MNAHRPALRLIASLICMLVLLMACATNKQAKDLDLTLSQYEKMVRWSQWDAVVDFIAPGSLEENPISPLDLDRLRLFRVTAYTVRSAVPYDDGMGMQQTVEIRLFNRNRAVERVLLDRQDWHWDMDRQRWFLHSGLPDVTQAR